MSPSFLVTILALGEIGLRKVIGLFSEYWGCSGSWSFFVEIDSYAIASLAMQMVGAVTRWGLFLVRGVQPFFLPPKSIAYWKAETLTEDENTNSGSSFAGDLFESEVCSLRSSVEGAGFQTA